MNLARTDHEGLPVQLSAQKDIVPFGGHCLWCRNRPVLWNWVAAAQKNFIQQTGPTISQILGIDFEGRRDRGIQIGTAVVEREGSLSSCTFGEAVTWGKYQQADEANLVQVWGEYSIIFPLLAAYVTDLCPNRDRRQTCAAVMDDLVSRLEARPDEAASHTVSGAAQ